MLPDRQAPAHVIRTQTAYMAGRLSVHSGRALALLDALDGRRVVLRFRK